MTELIADLEAAKRNVAWLLDHESGLVDMKGLVYWAGRVATLRTKIKESL